MMHPLFQTTTSAAGIRSLMDSLAGIMGYEDYCIWLTTQKPPLDERAYGEIHAALSEKLSAITEKLEQTP